MFTCNRGSNLHDIQDQNTETNTSNKYLKVILHAFDSDSVGSMQTAVTLSLINPSEENLGKTQEHSFQFTFMYDTQELSFIYPLVSSVTFDHKLAIFSAQFTC